MLTPEALRIFLGRARGSRATGLDGLSNQDLRNSPPASHSALCDLINMVITSALAPRQWLPNIIQLIPKPKGGDRPITITSALFSLVMDTIGVDMTDWQEEQEAFWDDAVKGSSAHRAALHRRMLDELEATEGTASLNGYCDI